MKNILLLVFFASNLSIACDLGVGKYEAIVMSEYSIDVTLKNDGEVEIAHKNWYGGDSIISEQHIYKGYWECAGNKIKIEYSIETIIGEIVTASLMEPYEINKSSKVLSFPKSSESGSVIGGWQFWPAKFIENEF